MSRTICCRSKYESQSSNPGTTRKKKTGIAEQACSSGFVGQRQVDLRGLLASHLN